MSDGSKGEVSDGSKAELAPTLPPSPLHPRGGGTPIHTKLFTPIWEQGPASWE